MLKFHGVARLTVKEQNRNIIPTVKLESWMSAAPEQNSQTELERLDEATNQAIAHQWQRRRIAVRKRCLIDE